MLYDDIDDKRFKDAKTINTTGASITAKKQFEKPDDLPGTGQRVIEETPIVKSAKTQYTEKEYQVKHIRSVMEDIDTSKIIATSDDESQALEPAKI